MKTIKLLTTALLSLSVGAVMQAQTCQASATIAPTANPGEITITDLSTTSSGAAATYSFMSFYQMPNWVYQGTVNLQPNSTSATYTFNQNGNYTYLIEVQDSITNCSDSSGGTFTITNIANASNCDASFYGNTANNQNTIEFFSTGNNSSSTTYYWDFGDGNTSSIAIPSHTYASSGWQYVCLTVIDSLGSTCYDNYCDSVYASGNSTPPCNASFYLFQDSVNAGVYYAWNNSTGSNLNYHWDFGDGNISNLAYPIHIYNSVGTYTLCLTVSDNNGCADTTCQTLTVVVKANGTTLNVLEPGQAMSVHEELTTIEDVNLFPNPSNGNFRLTLNSIQNVDIVVNTINLMGQTLKSTTINLDQGNNEIIFSNEDIPSGIYLMNIINEKTGETIIKKMIKE